MDEKIKAIDDLLDRYEFFFRYYKDRNFRKAIAWRRLQFKKIKWALQEQGGQKCLSKTGTKYLRHIQE